MRSCERPRKRSASEALPSSVSNLYGLSIRTQGSSCRSRASSSLRRVSSFSASSSSSRAASHCSRVPVLCFVIAVLPLLFDERPQAFGRVVPLRGDVVEVLLGFLQAFAVQVPDPLPPPAGVAHEPRVAEGVEVTRNGLSRHPGPFTETGNRQRPGRGQASQQAEPSRVAQRGEQRNRVGGGLQRGGGGAAFTRHIARGA